MTLFLKQIHFLKIIFPGSPFVILFCIIAERFFDEGGRFEDVLGHVPMSDLLWGDMEVRVPTVWAQDGREPPGLQTLRAEACRQEWSRSVDV